MPKKISSELEQYHKGVLTIKKTLTNIQNLRFSYTNLLAEDLFNNYIY